MLLMAESCIMGPGGASHIVCRDWPSDVVLFPQGSTLHCRTSGPIQVDGHEVEDQGRRSLDRRSRRARIFR